MAGIGTGSPKVRLNAPHRSLACAVHQSGTIMVVLGFFYSYYITGGSFQGFCGSVQARELVYEGYKLHVK